MSLIEVPTGVRRVSKRRLKRALKRLCGLLAERVRRTFEPPRTQPSYWLDCADAYPVGPQPVSEAEFAGSLEEQARRVTEGWQVLTRPGESRREILTFLRYVVHLRARRAARGTSAGFTRKVSDQVYEM